MKNIPVQIDCVVQQGVNPVQGLMLRAEFKTTRKNPYSIVFGPTNQEGCACLDHATIIQRADSQLNLALMDFDPLDKSFSGVLQLAVMQESDVQNALGAYELYKGVVSFPNNYENNLKSALIVLRGVDVRELTISSQVVPPSITVFIA